jgi:hypothetical protein
MRRLAYLIAFLAFLLPVTARGQNAIASAETNVHLTLTTPPPATLNPTQSPFPRPVHHCCHLKGFVIGASIGAGLGALWGAAWCGDEGSCAGGIITSMALFGGIGGGLGAFLDQRRGIPRAPTPPAFTRTRRVSVLGVLTGKIRAATAAVTF